MACKSGHSDVAQLLINKGASFDVTDGVSYYFYINNLNSASHFMIYFTVRKCVNVNIFSYFLCTQDGHSPLSWACARGHSDVAQLLINKGATCSLDVTDRVSYYFYINDLNSASHFVIYLTVRRCVNVNIFSYFLYTQFGRTPLSFACGSGHSDVAQLLINKGANLDVIDGVSYYFYMNNLNSARHFVIYLTVRTYVNVNIFSYFLYTQDGFTPLSWACVRGHSDVVQLLINKGASFDVTDKVSYYFYMNNLSSASHFVIYLTVKTCECKHLFLLFVHTGWTHSFILGLCSWS